MRLSRAEHLAWREIEGETFVVEGEEEIGSPHIANFVDKHRGLLGADLVITADGHLHESGAPVLEYGVRGIASFELRARGANRDVHSGNFGGVVPNPIWDAISSQNVASVFSEIAQKNGLLFWKPFFFE